ncbi:MAG: hypothetical protein M3279_07730 [Actinomycetota bacterium]|nr:hypothetical protein [Actinomycetota bacterium]
MNEHLIEFNHYFHHAADDARVSDDTLLTVVGEAFPVPWIHAAVRAARPAPGLDVDVVTMRARFEEEARRGIPSASAE